MKILLIKLGALGDVLRTTPLLEGLRKRYGRCEIDWLVDPHHRSVLEGNAAIARIQAQGDVYAPWKKTVYDLVINLDKEPEALDAFDEAKGREKAGFGRDKNGKLCAADRASDYAYRLGIDDDLKFRKNKKTYQEISFEQLGLPFQKEEYAFELDGRSAEQAASALSALKRDTARTKTIGLNTGSGARFAGKRLPRESYARLAERLRAELDAEILLLGGDDERERNAWLEKNTRVPVLDTGSHPIRVFAGIVKACDLVVTGDTTALHIAIAMKVPVLAYFASTCAPEIELYGRGRAIVSTLACAPCYKSKCPQPIEEQCMKEMDIERFVREAGSMLKAPNAHSVS